MGGSSWQVVSQPSATMWRALNDIGAYPRMLPNTASAREVEADEGEHVVELRHEVGFVHARYFLRMRFDDARRDVSFRLDPQRDNDLRSAWGFLSVDDFEEDPSRSLISFGVMAEPGLSLIHI